MRWFTSFTLPLLAASIAAQNERTLQLSEPKSGVTVTLPKDWKVGAADKGLIAVNDDRSAMVVLADCAQDFGKPVPDVAKSLQRSKLRDLKIEDAVTVAEADRGALQGLISVKGSGTNEDGDKVTFSAFIVKAGDIAGLAVGAWKDAKQAATVAGILEGICVQNPKSHEGLVLSETQTGASVTIPAGWVTMASKKGLLAWSQDRTAMTLIIRPQEKFDDAVTKASTFLKGHVLEDVEIGKFGEVSATDAVHKAEFARVVGASGKAKDRTDGKPVQLRVLAVQCPELDQGAMVLGAWKDEKGAAAVKKLLESIHVAKEEPAKKQ